MAFIVNTSLMSTVFYLFHLTKKYIGSKEGYIGLIFYWIAFEYFHYNWDASWPWLTLGNMFSITPSWVQWYSYSGVLGGTFWILLVNLLVFRVYQNVYFKGETWRIQTPVIWLASFAFLAPLLISIVTYFNYEEKANPVDVVAVQHNIDPYNDKFTTSVYDQYDRIVLLADSLVDENTDLIIAPETALSVLIDEENFAHSALFNYVVQGKKYLKNKPLYIGAFTERDFQEKHSRASRANFGGPGYYEHYNTSLFIGDDNQPEFIHKSKLVPGVETIPFSNHLPFLEDLSIDLGGGSGSLGIENEPKIFRYKKFNFAPAVCYESVFGEHIAQQCKIGAQMICIITNDGWWGDTPGYRQHQSFASLRAIENRRSVARSANTGSSCFINQRGDISQPTGWWKEAVIKETLNLNSDMTFYTRTGDALGRVSAFVAVLLLLYTFVRWFRKKFNVK